MVIVTIAAFIIIIYHELPDLLKKNNKRDTIVFICLCLIAFTFSMLLVSGVDIPSPVMPIYYFFDKLFGGLNI